MNSEKGLAVIEGAVVPAGTISISSEMVTVFESMVSGSGTCSPGTHVCQHGEGACTKNYNADNCHASRLNPGSGAATDDSACAACAQRQQAAEDTAACTCSLTQSTVDMAVAAVENDASARAATVLQAAADALAAAVQNANQTGFEDGVASVAIHECGAGTVLLNNICELEGPVYGSTVCASDEAVVHLKKGSCLHSKQAQSPALAHIATATKCEQAAAELGLETSRKNGKVLVIKDGSLPTGCQFLAKGRGSYRKMQHILIWNRHSNGQESFRKHRESICCRKK